MRSIWEQEAEQQIGQGKGTGVALREGMGLIFVACLPKSLPTTVHKST